MADEPKDPPPAADDDKKDLPTAQPHHKDKGTVVRTAFGEPMSGGVADIADGDD